MPERMCRKKLHLFDGHQCMECRRAQLDTNLIKRKEQRAAYEKARRERFAALGLTSKGAAKRSPKKISDEVLEDRRRRRSERKKKYRLANLEKFRAKRREYMRRWRAAHRAEAKAIDARKDALRRDTLSNAYVRKTLGLTKDIAPSALISGKREQIMLHRLNLQLKKAINQRLKGVDHDIR